MDRTVHGPLFLMSEVPLSLVNLTVHGPLLLMSEVPLYPVDLIVHGPLADYCQVDNQLSWYRGTSLTRNTLLLGPYSRTIPRVLWRS